MKELHLTNSDDVFLVDDDVFEKVKNCTLSKHTRGYVHGQIEGKVQYIHRFVMGAKPGQEVDHIDKNKLNNQRSNLRFCTRSQNNANTFAPRDNKTGYKGVNFDKSRGKFLARIGHNGRGKNLGRYDTAEAAAIAYNAAAIVIYGEFAQLNIIPQESL